MTNPDDIYVPPVDVCAICGEVYCDGIACVSDINPDDEADHPRLERLQDLVRAGKAWQKAALTLAHAEGRWICPDCGGCWSNPSDDLTVGMRYRCAICGEVTIATSPRPWPGSEPEDPEGGEQ